MLLGGKKKNTYDICQLGSGLKEKIQVDSSFLLSIQYKLQGYIYTYTDVSWASFSVCILSPCKTPNYLWRVSYKDLLTLKRWFTAASG